MPRGRQKHASELLPDVFLQGFTNPQFAGMLTPEGAVGQELSALLGANAPAATYNFDPRTGQGRLPHVQTSLGVFESAFRVAGMADPRFDDPGRVEASTRQRGAINKKMLEQLLQQSE